MLAHSNELTNEWLWADVLVLGVPMYNFGMPSNLKAWIDHIVRLGSTLHYMPEAKDHPFIGAFADRNVPVVVLSSRGDHGMNAGGPFAHMNHLDPAIGTALGLIGLREIHSIAVEHQPEGGEPLAQSVRTALTAATRLVDDLLRIQASNHSRSFA